MGKRILFTLINIILFSSILFTFLFSAFLMFSGYFIMSFIFLILDSIFIDLHIAWCDNYK